ncbi:hypothetical protein OJ996_10530 [Luteolibacter sp. GHJ8]|uniref:DUF4380 domain-containing protein n=1 Tax=Luteolibacter rhizosphaerae TaxID=2989719 RepID=A0ABT3G2X8_9BACT|nr:hypothetical protein [Luteolibacter rhizosphaerae]MCW1914012.1 hypothetical protein [Luteolibacter rhizosphaerae]
MSLRPLLSATLFIAPMAPAEEPAVASKTEFLDNGRIKIGVDMSSGGSIFWFSELPDGPNLLNHADRGRFVQQSYYGLPDGTKWGEKDWRWNPVQGGHYEGKPAKILEAKKTAESLYVKGIPIHWAGGQLLEDCRMEEWITLSGDVATIRFRFTYKGKEHHPATHQELPAVFVDYALPKLVYYKGEKPWTGDALSEDVPAWPNEYRRCTEEWAAYIGPDGRGLGVFFPGTKDITCYRYQGAAGPAGIGCSYFAPIQTLAVVPGFEHDYRIHLKIGTVAEIRESFKKLRR